jgi:extracellular elastinolytic metalloproteinase
MAREVDHREFRVGKSTPAREYHLHSLANARGLLPGEHRVRITRFDATTGNPAAILSESAPALRGNYVQRALEHVHAIKDVMGLEATQPPEFAADPHFQTASSGAVAVHLQQQYKGIPIFEASATVRFAPNGALTETAGGVVTVDRDVAVSPRLSVVEAVQRAARYIAEPDATEREGTDQFGVPLATGRVDLTDFEPRILQTFANDPAQPTVLEAGPFGQETQASLVWFPLGDAVRLAWQVILTLQGLSGRYRTVVDADSGEILYARNLTQTVAARGNVFFPSGASPRRLVNLPPPLADYPLNAPPAGLPTGFPDDWVTAEGTTFGNSVNAHLGDAGLALRGTVQQGVLTFDPADPNGDDQKILNIFYYNCFMHDFFYLLGFREAEGNFQKSNFGRGGLAGDPVDARAYSGTVANTASMTTFTDGASPIMRMGLVPTTGFHTAFDASVVFHEFTHGVTNRLVGGRLNEAGLEAPQSRGMGEGWSDYFACSVLDVAVVAAWVVGNARGIRAFPYDANFPVAANNFGSLGTGRYTEEHNVGEIWCATLMEINRKIGKRLGWQLVVDALKLSRATPSFLDMRDAIVLALDHQLAAGQLSASAYAGARSAMWATFAKFGMGPGARSNGAFLTGVMPDFTPPPDVGPGQLPTPTTPGAQVEETSNVTIPDNDPAGVTRTLSVAQPGRVARLVVSVDIAHPYVGDLQVSLARPGGTPVVLHDRTGGSADNLVRSYASEDTPALIAFTGEPAQGDWILKVADLAGKDVGTLLTWRLAIDLASAPQVVRGDAEPALTVPDNELAGVNSSITVTPSGAARSIKVSVDITHTYIGDLVVELTAPSGQRAILHDRSGGQQGNLITTYDSTTNAALAALVGQPIRGNWVLRVTDLAGKDVGKLNRWSLELALTDETNALDMSFDFPDERTKQEFETALQTWLQGNQLLSSGAERYGW